MKFRLILSLLLVLVVSSPAYAGDQAKKSGCRKEVKELCGDVSGEEKQSCIDTKRSSLSPECAAKAGKKQAGKKEGGKKKKKKAA